MDSSGFIRRDTESDKQRPMRKASKTRQVLAELLLGKKMGRKMLSAGESQIKEDLQGKRRVQAWCHGNRMPRNTKTSIAGKIAATAPSMGLQQTMARPSHTVTV